MHSLPCVALHPDGTVGAFQSMDNQILLYGTSEGNYKLTRSKRYMGHLVAGYACGLDFSPDGSYIVSGDSEGKLFFWDYVTAKMVRKLPGGHKGPVSTVVWHPHQPSTCVSGGWDGKILIWD
jgi:pre-mRNA-processing factor 17